MLNKAVILCGGLNTRFMPVTKSIPKEMLPVGNKPITQVLIEQLAEAGVNNVLLIITGDKKVIYNHFRPNKKMNKLLTQRGKVEQIKELEKTCNLANVSYILQKKPLGTAYCVQMAKKWVNNEPFVLLNGDEILLNDISSVRQLIEAYNKTNSSIIGVKQVPTSDIHRYGIVDPVDSEGDVFKLKGIVEKPKAEDAPSNYANIGCYLLTPEIYNHIDLNKIVNGECYITNSLDELCKNGSCYAKVIKGLRYDLGDPDNYAINHFDYCLHTSDNKQKFIDYINKTYEELHK